MPTSRNRKKKAYNTLRKELMPYKVVKPKLWMFETPDFGEMPFGERVKLF